MLITLFDKNQNPTKYCQNFTFWDEEELIIKLKKSHSLITAKLSDFEKTLNCDNLIKIQKILESKNINLDEIITNSRETIISANYLNIRTQFAINLNQLSYEKKIKEIQHDIIYRGTIRSGNKISSNGNLFILGDVNPGGQISAKKNIYVWGRLRGIAFAGKEGDDNSTIASLYLNPLQLRINKTIAVGPAEKPTMQYPEVALIENKEIVIKPLLINK